MLVSRHLTPAAPVPEPATWVLLIASLPILAFLRSRRRAFESASGELNRSVIVAQSRWRSDPDSE